jgi:hypothetical protein
VPQASHHIACVTHRGDEVREFLTEVIGLGTTDTTFVPGDVAEEFLAWPTGNAGGSAVILGSGSRGLVEVVDIPPELRDSVQAGSGLISFIVPDLEQRLEQARSHGYRTGEIRQFMLNEATTCSAALVTAGDLTFELFRIEQP